MHLLHFGLGGSTSLEPRMAVKWQQRPGPSWSLAAGLHSAPRPSRPTWPRTWTPARQRLPPQRGPGSHPCSASRAGLDQRLAEDVQLRVEAYQHLYDRPVENDRASAFVLNNSGGWFTTRDLVNAGLGRNFTDRDLAGEVLQPGLAWHAHRLGVPGGEQRPWTACGAIRASMVVANYGRWQGMEGGRSRHRQDAHHRIPLQRDGRSVRHADRPVRQHRRRRGRWTAPRP